MLAGCLGDGDAERVRGASATVYVSTPRHGVSAADGRAALAGMRRALAERGGRAGGLEITLRALPATEDAEHAWDPDAVSSNADRAADDPRAIAYVGELDFGASAVSLPITNEAGLLQVSPADGLTSLTRQPPGRPRAGPERYYPSERRSFARIGPMDLDEAELLVERAAAGGADRLGVVFERGIYGRELAGQVVTLAREAGLDVVASEQYGDDVEELPELARALAGARPGALVHAGVAGRATGRLLAAIDARLPGVPLYASSGILARSAPVPAAPELVEALAAEPPPEQAGYEAMRLVLAAVDSGSRDRRRVIEAGLRLARRARPHAITLSRLGSDGRFEPSGARFSPR